jgi:restriction system protein
LTPPGLAGQQATKGVFITTSSFTQNAVDFAKNVSQKVILIDGERLAYLMIEHDVGVSKVRSITIKRIDAFALEAGQPEAETPTRPS